MPKNILSKFIVSSLVILFFNGCKPEKPEDPPSLHAIPQEVKDYCYFKMGSWWIYKDSLSGAYDTVVMTESILDTINYLHGDKVVQYSEVFKTRMFTTYDNYFTKIAMPIPPRLGLELFIIRITRYKPGDGGCPEYYHLYPYEAGKILSGDASDTTILLYDKNNLKIYSHAKMCGFHFAKVIETQKRNIGVIRREIRNPYYPAEQYIWKLDSYHVEQ